MPIQVQGPDGQLLEFPDGTDRETMRSAMQRRYGGPQQPKADPLAAYTRAAQGTGSFASPRAAAAKGNPANNSAFAGLITGDRPKSAPIYARGPLGKASVGAQIGGALDAFQHHVMNIPHGLAQLVEHGVNAAANAAMPESSGIRQYINRTVAQDDAALRNREAAYQGRTDGIGASYIGAGAGEVLPWMVGIGELKAAGVLPKLKPVSQVAGFGNKAANVAAKAGLLAAEGGAMAAAQPVTEGDYGRTKAAQVATGAVAAPVIGAVAGGLGKAAGARKYLTAAGRDEIAGKRLSKIYGTDPATLARLRQQSSVPGFVPTPAQALQTPEAIQAERILRNGGMTAPAFAQAEAANNAALRGVVSNIAQEANPLAVAQAKAARTAATQPYYDSLVGQRIPVRSIIDDLDGLEQSGLGTVPNVKTAVNSLRQEILNRAQYGSIDASVLSGIRENVHRHLGDMPTDQEKKALGPIANSIADALDAGVPGYRANLAAYAQKSQPISDIRAGRQFLDAIDSGSRDALGGQNVSLNQVRSILAKDDKAKFGMSSGARSQLEALLDAAQQRSTTNNTIAASGPGTAADALRGASPFWQRLMQQAVGGVGAGVGTFAGGPMGAIGGYLAGVGASEGASALNNAVLRQMGNKAASAPLTAEAIEAYLRANNPSMLPNYYAPASALLPYSTQP